MAHGLVLNSAGVADMKKALKLALEALMDNEHYVAENERHAYVVLYNEVIEKCKAALAQPVQEPVGVFCEDDDIGYVRLIPHQQMKLKAWDKLYTAPQQRPWVGLMDEDKETLILKHAPPLHPDYKDDSLHGLLQAANDFLRELNT